MLAHHQGGLLHALLGIEAISLHALCEQLRV
jgi:hypothetical protein